MRTLLSHGGHRRHLHSISCRSHAVGDPLKGSRFAQGGASADITLTRKVGNRALNTLVNALYGTSYTDLCYGYNAFWARCLPYMRVDCDGFVGAGATRKTRSSSAIRAMVCAMVLRRLAQTNPEYPRHPRDR